MAVRRHSGQSTPELDDFGGEQRGQLLDDLPHLLAQRPWIERQVAYPEGFRLLTNIDLEWVGLIASEHEPTACRTRVRLGVHDSYGGLPLSDLRQGLRD